jgi:hypothetical protein
MKALFVLLVCAFCLSAVSYAADEEGPAGKRVLALLEDASYKSTHSIFFKSLEGIFLILSFHHQLLQLT